MKQGFWTGILVTIVSGALLWVGNEFYSQWKQDRAKVVNYEIRDKEVIVAPNLRTIVKTLEDGNQISSVQIQNTGNEDLAEFQIRITDVISSKGENILGYGVLEKIGDKTEDVRIDKKDGVIYATFPIIRPKEGAKIWIAHRGYTSLDVRNSQSGVILQETNALSESDSELWNFLFYGGIAFGVFILGMIASEALNQHMLRRIGFDPKEVAQLYAEAEKKKNA